MTTMADSRIVAMLRAAGAEVDRENFIAANWGHPPPDPWLPEHEGEIPKELQDWSWFTPENVGGADDGEELAEDKPLRSHASVDYESPAKGPHQCGECKHFWAPEDCELVESPISAGDWCKLFSPE